MGADSDDGEPIDAGDLPAVERDVLAAGWLWQREPNCFSVVVPLLPGLIIKTRLLVEVTAGEEHRRACRAQALLGHLGQEVLARLGEPDLSWVAANQSADAAEQVGDPALSGAGAARELEPALDEPSGELLSVYGGLHLVGAIASARAGDRLAVQHLLDRARTTAARLGADRNDYWMTFGPTNVAMHDVAVLIESGDPKGAIRHGATVDPSGLASLERQSTHHVQLAHAYTLQRKDSEAVRELLVAERLNPEGVRYNMLAHDFVRGMLRRERRRVTPGLRGLARRLNLLDW